MKLRTPTYFNEFHCIADKCKDCCCIGWEIDIDKKSADFYKNVSGEFGEKLRKSIDFGSPSHFALNDKNRCPLLNNKNLCEVYIQLGEDKMCDICTEHPRYYEWFNNLKEGGIVTINYAYEQNGVTIYPDLIKVKVALDNGEILGVETSGYLNNHTERTFTKAKISIEEAKSKLNKSLEITSEGMAIIPTEWKTEILCYEFKGKIDDTDFLVYTNVETGREENILVIIDTPNGILTQ